MKIEGVSLPSCYPDNGVAFVAPYRNIDLVYFQRVAEVEDWMRIYMP